MITPTKIYKSAYVNTDAGLREIVSALIAGLDATGLVRTNDTGQINPVTVLYPAAANSSAGYLIYRFNDSLQSTKPVYLKIRISRGSGAGALTFGIQIGTGSDGAGNLTGLTNSENGSSTVASPAATVDVTVISGDVGQTGTGWISFCWQVTNATTTTRQFFSISRTRNSDGQANNQGLAVFGAVGSSYYTRFFDFTNNFLFPSAGDITGLIAVIPPTSTSSYSFNGQNPVFPCQPVRPYLDYNTKSVVLYTDSEISVGQMFRILVNGEYCKYLACGRNAATSPNAYNTGLSYAVRIG